MKLAVIATHPIQYQAPLWRAIAANGKVNLRVFFASRHGLDESVDPGFRRSFAWDVPLLEGYESEFVSSLLIPGCNGPVANRFPKQLAKRLLEGRFDAVLVNGYTTAAAWAGMLAAWLTKTPLLMRGESHEHGRPGGVRKLIKGVLLPSLLRRVDGFLAIGRWNEEYWRRHGVPTPRICTALYSVDNVYFGSRSHEQKGQAKALRSKWGVPSDGTVFLYCGKLLSVKAPEILLRAFAILSAPSAQLVYVGTGSREASLKEVQRELRLERVHWEGFVKQSALPSYYRAADVLVLPSRFEPWGLVVNEAMACGTPCIVSDVVGAGADLLEGQDTGLIFPHDDVRALASALHAALDPELRQCWKNNIPKVLAKANLQQNVEALEALLAQTVERRGEAKGTP